MQQATCAKCGTDVSRPVGRPPNAGYHCTTCRKPSGKHASCCYCAQPSRGERFCSTICSELHAWERRAAPIKIRQCAECSTLFPSLSAASKYCSPACKSEADRALARARHRASGPKKRKPKHCPICSTTYNPTGFYQQTCGDPVCMLIQRGGRTSEPIRFTLTVLRPCHTCGQHVKPDSPYRAYCSTLCQGRRNIPRSVLDAQRTCQCGCGETWRAGDHDLNRQYATDRCSQRVSRRAGKARRRAQKKNASRIETIRLDVLAERDGWKCHICKRKVTRKTWSHDHLVPLSAGGTHTYDNVALAHHRCNTLRGARGAAQLLLMG